VPLVIAVVRALALLGQLVLLVRSRGIAAAARYSRVLRDLRVGELHAHRS
jgi:hypothetical protein